LTFYFNHPSCPQELHILEVLKRRFSLTPDSSRLYHSLKKGYDGETKWHKLLKRELTSNCIVLYDLLLDRSDSLFQLDCIIIQQRVIWHLEIKNYEGDFIMKNEKMYKLPGEHEVNNPLNQIERGQRLMGDLLKIHAFHFPIKSYVIFVHSEFSLYQLQRHMPIILPTQINQFITGINQTPSKMNTTHNRLANQLWSLRVSHSLSNRLPKYEFDQLKKGIPCIECNGWMVAGGVHGKSLLCDTCGKSESRESAILRSVCDFHLLFPSVKITTDIIWKWINETLSKY